MLDAFAEGVRSIVQVCHLVVLAPVALTIVAARGRWPAVIGAVVGVVLGGWLFVTNALGTVTELQLRISSIVLIVVVVVLGLPRILQRSRCARLRRFDDALQSPAGTGGIIAAVAAMVTQWWRPCVGVELGSILTLAPDDPIGQLLPTVGFMLGVAMPLVVVGLIYAVWRPSSQVATRAAWVAAALTVVLAGSVLAGQHGEIVSRLFQWSQ